MKILNLNIPKSALQQVNPELEGNLLFRFRAWERGFDAHCAGHPITLPRWKGGGGALWRQGWKASQHMDKVFNDIQPCNP